MVTDDEWGTAVITCANCGVRNEPDATFCQACHHFLEWEVAVDDDDDDAIAPSAPLPVEPAPPVETSPPVETTLGASPEPVATPAPPPVPTPAPAPVPTSEPPRVAAPVAPGDPVRGALDTVAEGRALSLASGREDLAAHLEQTHTQIAAQVTSVAVVGEFKRGKSTLINALLQTAVCPVDADIVTAIPTVVRYGERTSVTAYLEPTADDPEPAPVEVPTDQVAAFVSEAGNPGNRRRLQMVEVALPHPMLRTGLCLVDTPGVGGLDSSHGLITLSALNRALGMVFLTDASQELTGAEIEFLRAAVQRCPNAVCVLTKTDLYPEWRRILDVDQAHLRDAGLDTRVLPVSSFLRMAATDDHDMLLESGFPALVDFLLGTVVPAGAAKSVETAEAEVEFIAAQLEDQLRAEQQVLEHPDQADDVVERLDVAREKSKKLVAPNSTWQQMLSDGIQDLVANVEFDLQERLRTVLRDAEAIIDEGDPRQTWLDVDVWLRRQVVAAAVANYDRMSELADELAEGVASAFDLAAGEFTTASSITVTDSLASIRMATAASLESPGGRVASMLMAGRTATLIPMVIVGALGHLLLPIVAAPIAVFLAGGIGQKVIKDEKRRQVAYRQQQAKSAARKYIDEVAFMVSKDSRDALRATQRALRDDFQNRAAALQRSSEAAFRAAQSAKALPPEQRNARSVEVARETAEIIDLRSRRRAPDSTPAVVNG